MRRTASIVVIVIIIALIIIIPFACRLIYYNRFVSLDQAIKAQWAQVESVLKRRADLIPNLVESTKGFMGHEREIYENIAEARTKLAGAQTVSEKIEAERGLGAALGRLLMIVENYPQLKANETFAKLMDELAGTENRIGLERRRYNENVRIYNTTIKRWPASFFATRYGFKEAPYFEVAPEEQQVPKVEF